MEDHDEALSQLREPEVPSPPPSPRLLAMLQSAGFASPPPPTPTQQPQQQGIELCSVCAEEAAAAAAAVEAARGMEAPGPRLATQQQQGIGLCRVCAEEDAAAAVAAQQPTLAPPLPQQNQGVGFGGTGAGAATVSPAPRGTTMARERAAEQIAYDDAISRLINNFAGHDKDAIHGKNTSNVQVFDDIHEGDAIRMAELEEFEKQVLALNAAAWNDAASSCGEEPAMADNFLNGEEQREEEDAATERRSWTLERWELELKASCRRVVEANERVRGVQRERERVRREVAALLQQRVLERQQMSALWRERALAHERFVLQQRQWRQQMVEQQQQQQRAPVQQQQAARAPALQQQQRMPVVQQAAPRKQRVFTVTVSRAYALQHQRGSTPEERRASVRERVRLELHKVVAFLQRRELEQRYERAAALLRQRAQLEQAALQQQLKLEMQQMRRRQEQRQLARELAIMPQPQGHRNRGGGMARHPDAAIAQGGLGVGHNDPRVEEQLPAQQQHRRQRVRVRPTFVAPRGAYRAPPTRQIVVQPQPPPQQPELAGPQAFRAPAQAVPQPQTPQRPESAGQAVPEPQPEEEEEGEAVGGEAVVMAPQPSPSREQ
uniref:GLTSCR protein conserved domain-containing protein n=1 Tax=Oryza meridionalis TaxID=40149 RepID=A0A0E0D130_9ORYZ